MSEIAELEGYRLCGISRGSDRLGKHIHTVGEIERSVGVFIDKLLDSFGYVSACVGLEVIGYHNVACVLEVDNSVVLFNNDVTVLVYVRGSLFRELYREEVLACVHLGGGELSENVFLIEYSSLGKISLVYLDLFDLRTDHLRTVLDIFFKSYNGYLFFAGGDVIACGLVILIAGDEEAAAQHKKTKQYANCISEYILHIDHSPFNHSNQCTLPRRNFS